MHGPTFMGNPLACAIALASLKLMRGQDMAAVVAKMEAVMRRELAPAARLPQVEDVRVLGSIGVVEVKKPVDVGAFQKRCVEEGVWIRPFGRNVYVMPPYVTPEADLVRLCRTMVKLVEELPQ